MGEADSVSEKRNLVRTWYDYKRCCYVSNVAFVLAASDGEVIFERYPNNRLTDKVALLVYRIVKNWDQQKEE